MKRSIAIRALLVLWATASRSATAARAVEDEAEKAAIWGMPIVSVDAMREAFFRDAGARYGDIVYLSKPANWKFQIATPNASVRYVYFNFNLKNGPVVIDIPAAAGLFGSVLDAWQEPRADIGAEGDDHGKGGKYLLVPARYAGKIPSGYIVVHFQTVNGYATFRAIAASAASKDMDQAITLIKKVRVYPLAQAAEPPPQRFVDMADKVFDGIVRFDDSFYARLARMLDEEPALSRDAAMVADLKALGIEKGKDFAPDASKREQLNRAAEKVRAKFVASAPGDGELYRPETSWRTPSIVGAKTKFTFEKNGVASVYLANFVDGAGEPLSGEDAHQLHVPANVPAAQFWAATVYDANTAAFIRGAPRVELNSYAQELQKNADGSVDIYFGPEAPRGKKANWLYTAPGKAWFAFFRFYGPEAPVKDKTWTLPNIEKVTTRHASAIEDP